jgi:hypothetical protein
LGLSAEVGYEAAGEPSGEGADSSLRSLARSLDPCFRLVLLINPV